MQRMILRTITVMSVMCLCLMASTTVFADNLKYGPEEDPVISNSSENISLTCPPPITVDCDENGIYMTYAEFEAAGGSVNLPAGCEVDSFTFVMDVEVSQSGCFFVYLRQYFITETCGNTFTCNQIIMLTDDDDPVFINPPSDTTLEVTGAPCTVAYDVPQVEVTDGCSMVTVVTDSPNDFEIGTTTVTYTATDGCGNSSQITMDVTVENNSPITVTCPPDIMDNTVCDISEIPPYADFAAFEAAGGTATRECDQNGTTYVLEGSTDTVIGGSCPKTVNRIYTVSDGNGNEDTCLQVITIIDDEGPSFTVPPMMEIECTVEPDTSVTGVPTAITDNCDSTFTVSFSDSAPVPGSCMGEYTFTRTWTVTDQCDNPTMDTQTISVVDNTPPTAMCKDTLFVYLDNLGNAVIVADSLDNGSFDDCSDVTFTADMSFASCNQVGSPTTAELTVADDCDNEATCDVVIVTLDTMSIILNAPEDDTIACIADLDPPYASLFEFMSDGGTDNDNCPAGNTFSLISNDTTGTCPTIVERIYEYVDFAGNSDTALHTTYIIDDEAPLIAMCPADISISETDLCDTLLVFGSPVATDNCGSISITNDYTNNSDTSAVFSGGVTTIVFTVSDDCGNSDTCSMTVTVAAEPQFTCPPLDMINSPADLPDYPDLQAFLNAGGMINMFCAIVDSTFMYSNEFIFDADSCTATITEMVMINDTLGNTLSATKNTAIMDTIDPEIGFCFDQFTVLDPFTCEFDTTFILPSVTDNFGVDTTYFVIGDFIMDTALITFYAEDFCGNIDSCQFDLIVNDPTSPDLGIDTLMIMCDTMGAIPIYNTIDEFLMAPGAFVTDCRLDSASFQLDTTYMDMDGNVVNQYSVQDFSDQTGTTNHVISIMDSTNPEITSCTPDISMDAAQDTCGLMVSVPQPQFMDNCMGTITLTNDYNGTDDASDFYPVGTTTVIWTVEDENGLTDTCSFTVTITDTTPPVVTCPADTMIVCSIENYPPFIFIPDFLAGGGTIQENCMIMGINSVTDSIGPNLYRRSYQVIDSNGLSDTCFQTIEVIDTIAPTIMDCVPMYIFNTDTSSCDATVNILPPSLVDDDCDTLVTITNSIDGMPVINGTFSDTTDGVWYFTDDFGNVDSCEFQIIINDATGPVVVDPDVDTIMCIADLAGVNEFTSVDDIVAAGGSATDNCGIDSVNLVQTTMVGDTVKRVYDVIDLSGNTSSITHCIIIDDTTPPSFDAPADVTIDCDADVDDLSITGTVDTMLLMDNCMELDTLIFMDIENNASCPLVSEITRIWTLTDVDGNMAVDTQIISLIDTIPPSFNSMPAAIANINCNDALPAQEVLTADDDCLDAVVLMDTLPFMVDICSGYDVTYRWIALDECDNRDTITATFSVNPDTTPPSLLAANDITIGSEGDICGVRVDSISMPDFEEDCSGFMLTSNFLDTIYPVGVTAVLWTATNDCGVSDTVTQTITVIDSVPPVVLCKDATAGLTKDPQNFVYASSFVEMSDDNCEIQSILIKRATPACGELNNVFADSILICCDDIGTDVEVEVRIVDASGNENFCDATLTVEDNRAPVVMEDLPDITISCSYFLDTLNLDEFGTFVSDSSLREDIIVEDIYYADQDSIAGIDGWIMDECDVTVEDSTVVELNICNTGIIRRIFTFTDVMGNSSTAEQIIEVRDTSPFNINGTDIIWPEDFTWSHCGNPAPDTSISGSPVFLNDDKCALVAATFKDVLFDYPYTNCPKVRRTWKVIDWCQYDDTQDPNPGLWTYNQYIFVENTTPPTITTACQDTLVCTPNNDCNALVSLSIEAEDDCPDDTQHITYGYYIDVNNDSDNSNDLSGSSNSFSEVLELGVHEITWTATDRCGNDTTCTYLITVEECKAPTAVCLSDLIVVLDDSGEAELWASDVDQNSFDNCTDEDDLIFSFSSDVEDFGRSFDCDDVGIPQVVEMWVTDLEGNQSFCEATVHVQDTGGFCASISGNGNADQLQGKIATETNMAIPEAMVSIFGAEMDDEFMTEDDGSYVFDNINEENDYQVSVDRDKEYLQGITTLDLVLIQRHILDLKRLDSPYKLIAADINNNERISASDLVSLRKLILGIDDNLPDNTSWRFVSKNTEMQDMENPWPFGEDLIVGNDPIQEIEADFVGVKVGDVNNSVDMELTDDPIAIRNAKNFGMVTRDQFVQKDNEVMVDFISNQNMNLEALQMTIEWNVEKMSFIDIIPVGILLEEAHFNLERIEDGIVTVAWNSIDAKEVGQELPVFQMIFEGNTSSRLSDHLSITSQITRALAYDNNDDEYNVELRFVEGIEEGFALLQNRPNPFVSETTVEFSLPEEMEVTFKIFNSAGILIHQSTNYFEEGQNSFRLDEQLNGHRGMLFLKMEAAEFSDIKRMIRIE